MGSFLDKPSTEKSTEAKADANLGISAGAAAMQGWRITMEDAHTLQIGLPGHPDYCWFAVYDGHGGSLTSTLASKSVLRRVMSTPEWQKDSVSPESIGRAIIRGFLDIDEELRKLPAVASGEDRSGSTAIAALLTPTHIIVANCGDSRCILLRANEVVEMSDDHKPYNDGEQRRIEAAGGTVTMRRVNGDLAVSRALGDFCYKHAPLPPESQQVSAEPEIRVVARSPGADQFLLLACDGVWDVMTNGEVGSWLLHAATEGGLASPVDLSSNLIDECLARGSRDNMSAVVVAFKGAPQPSREAVERARQLQQQQAAAAAHGDSDADSDDGHAGRVASSTSGSDSDARPHGGGGSDSAAAASSSSGAASLGESHAVGSAAAAAGGSGGGASGGSGMDEDRPTAGVDGADRPPRGHFSDLSSSASSGAGLLHGGSSSGGGGYSDAAGSSSA